MVPLSDPYPGFEGHAKTSYQPAAPVQNRSFSALALRTMIIPHLDQSEAERSKGVRPPGVHIYHSTDGSAMHLLLCYYRLAGSDDS